MVFILLEVFMVLPLLDVFKDSHEPLSFVHTPVIVM